MSADDIAFQVAWDRFAAGVATWTPAGHAALREPATDEQIEVLEAALGFALHPALKALLATHDGADEILPAAFLPQSYRLATTEEIVEEYRVLVAYADENSDNEEAEGLRWEVPFASPWCDGTGVAYVDHRPGPTFGAVYECGAELGLSGPTAWGADLTVFLAAVADSLVGGEPFDGLRPVREESLSGKACLSWTELN